MEFYKERHIIYIDNQDAIHITKNPAITPRTKHVDIKARYLQHLVALGGLTVKYMLTRNFHAKLQTKNLPEELHTIHTVASHNGIFSYVENKRWLCQPARC
jgi:hypothetical protein